MPDGRGVHAAAVEGDGGGAINEDIVDDMMVTAAAEECGPRDAVEDVADDFGSADAVVHVHAHRSHADAASFVDEVVTDDIAAEGPVAAGVDGADIAGLEGDMVDLVELDDVVVAGVEDGAMRVIVDEVIGDSDADA